MATKAELEAEIEALKAEKYSAPPVAETTPVETTPVVDSEGSTDTDETPVPVKWKNLVKEILGPEFECELVQPDNGGTQFKIIVPRDLSNAPQMYWEMHNRDVRTREIGNTGLVGVKEWCLKVRQNLIRSGIKLVQYQQ